MIEALILWKVWDIHSEMRDQEPVIGLIGFSVFLQLFIWPIALAVTLSRSCTWPLVFAITLPLVALSLLWVPMYFIFGFIAAGLLANRVLDSIN